MSDNNDKLLFADYDAYVQVLAERVTALKELFEMMPDDHRRTCEAVIRTLVAIAAIDTLRCLAAGVSPPAWSETWIREGLIPENFFKESLADYRRGGNS